MRVLHLSADYPDPLVPGKTRAIANLLALAQGHEHRVVSLNRVGRGVADPAGWRGGIDALDFADAAGRHRAVAQGAPPFGVGMRGRFRRLGHWILRDCAEAGFRPDLVHAHKLSVEGPPGLAVARALGVPLVLSVQGQSDGRILAARPDLRPLWRAAWREAAVVFPFAPWAAARMNALLGPRPGPVIPLPCPLAPGLDRVLRPEPAGPRLLSAFHLASARRKNAPRLIRAVGLAARSVAGLRLDIAGGGDPAAFAALGRVAGRSAPGAVRFLGGIDPHELRARAHASAAFVLVSQAESYGMVFAEALSAGAPCLYPRGRAIDGYLEDGGAVLAADPRSVEEIARGIVRLVREEAAFKARLDALGRAGGLAFMGNAAIRASYFAGLEAAFSNTRS